MNFRRLTDNDLADMAANVAVLLAGTELSAINAAFRASVAAAIGTLPEALEEQTAAASNAEGTRKAAVSTKNATRELLIAYLAQVKNALRAGVATKDQYDLCGFDFPETSSGPYQAQDPTELTALGYSNGVNRIKFRGNNSQNSAVYEVWRREGDEGQWALLAMTKKRSFLDAPVKPGQYYEYKVRAQSAKTMSNFSNIAAVYSS